MKQINNFWNWFQDNHHLISKSDENANQYYETALYWLGEFLGYYCPHLIYIVIQKSKGTEESELIISANSDPDYYGEVITLVDAAPKIIGWKITAFIQPCPELLDDFEGDNKPFIFQDIILTAEDLLFIPWDNDQNDKMILKIYCRQFTMGCKKKHWEKALHIYIQQFIGEINYGNHIAFVELARKYKETKHSIHLYDLPFYIETINTERRFNEKSNHF